MKILMVASYLPFPLLSGGQVRLYNLIKELSQKHEVSLICEMRDTQSENDIREVEKICEKVITVNRKKQWSIGNILSSVFSSNSFLLTGHTLGEMRSKISTELKNETYNLIHVETYYVMQNLPPVSIPVVLVEHNIEYMVYKRFVDKLPVLFRPILGVDVNKIRNEEEDFWKKADKLVAVSIEDQKVMAGSGVDAVLVANGVDTRKFGYKEKFLSADTSRDKKVLFIGDFKWIQNRDTASFILREVWPLASSKFKVQSSKLVLWFVGRDIPDSVRNLSNDSDVIFDEASSQKPTEQLFQEADLLLAPIRVGGGTSYKILESMSCGTPVVTTRMSADAIEAEDNNNIMVGENAQELADKAVELLTDPKLYEKLAHNGRKLIEEKYTWEKIAGELEKVYQNVTEKNEDLNN